ncbi:MAG TPA: sugar nucleotide-binding protein, partial [Acidimicrobiales bacterium]|nr:sugar nucleotide-binding protein [Acidimicrobiales bacterium]
SPGPLRFVVDQRGCPTFTADLAGVLAELGCARRPGIFHVTNDGVTSWYDFARAVLAAAGDDPSRVQPVRTAELDPPRPAPRPENSHLDNAALRLGGFGALPPWEDALARLVKALSDADREDTEGSSQRSSQGSSQRSSQDSSIRGSSERNR